MSVLLLGIVIGIAIRYIENEDARKAIFNTLRGAHDLLIAITRWIVVILPIGLFGFITSTVIQLKTGINISGIGGYLTIIIASNLIQGLIILPIWIRINNLNPSRFMKFMMPALSVAFFSKSSSGTLPVTISTAENAAGIHKDVSRFVLPLCTTINMNGCASFIFTTVLYLMQNHGVSITFPTMLLWIVISTIAAAGNAGVPMGCFFLSASLLAR